MVYPEPEVFPVRVRANGVEIWLVSGTYESFFSRCEVGAAVGMDTEIISGADVACAIRVLEDGLAMIEGLRRSLF